MPETPWAWLFFAKMCVSLWRRLAVAKSAFHALNLPALRNQTLLGWLRWILAPSDASRTSLSWQPWILAPSDASRNRTSLSWQPRILAPSDASRNRTSLSWQPWILAPLDASMVNTCPARTSKCAPTQGARGCVPEFIEPGGSRCSFLQILALRQSGLFGCKVSNSKAALLMI